MSAMPPRSAIAARLRGVDLNLFVVFAAIMAEGSVSGAAERLHMSQAAVSAALKRLRELVDDPLFVRHSAGMTPTALAHTLDARVNAALAGLHDVVTRPDTFDPHEQEATFRVAMSDDLEVLLMPALIDAVREVNAGSAVFCVQGNRSTAVDVLRSGAVELVLAADSAWPTDIRSSRLFDAGYACLSRPEMLDEGVGPERRMSLQRYLDVDHVMISADASRGIVDELLADQGLARHRITATSHFAMAPLLVAHSGAVATMPAYAAERWAAMTGLVASHPPIDLPRFGISALWHAGSTERGRIAWLLSRIREAATTAGASLTLAGVPTEPTTTVPPTVKETR